MIDQIRQLEAQMQVYGIQTQRIILGQAEYRESDLGMSQQLFRNYDYAKGMQLILDLWQEHTVYWVKDEFGVCRYFFLLPHTDEKEREMICVGPFLVDTPEPLLQKMIEKHHMDVCGEKELEKYYYSIPYISEIKFLEGILLLQVFYIYGEEENIGIEHFVDFYGKNMTEHVSPYREEQEINVQALEERYRVEEELLEAVKKGDRMEAYAAYRKLAVHAPEQRMVSTMENCKYFLLTLNTLFRKAVEAAGVHPVHIDQLSGEFVRRIGKSAHEKEMKEMSREMIRRYCILVKKYAFLGYSAMVRDTVNYIDLHLQESLSLKKLSEAGNISPSYLSSRFKKETGQSVMDYVNEQRVMRARRDLAATDLSISEIAERVGISDGNYFTKLFKKYQKCTPKEYRNIIHSK